MSKWHKFQDTFKFADQGAAQIVLVSAAVSDDAHERAQFVIHHHSDMPNVDMEDDKILAKVIKEVCDSLKMNPLQSDWAVSHGDAGYTFLSVDTKMVRQQNSTLTDIVRSRDFSIHELDEMRKYMKDETVRMVEATQRTPDARELEFLETHFGVDGPVQVQAWGQEQDPPPYRPDHPQQQSAHEIDLSQEYFHR